MDIKKIIKESLVKVLGEASLSKVYNAARKGSYPITLVAIENGKVVDQKLVGTPEIVPAAFNEMQKEFPKAQINIEDRKGKILFKEGKLPKRFTVKTKKKIGDTLYNPGTYALKKKRAGGGIYLNMDNNQMLGVDEGDIKQLTENMKKGYTVVYRDKAFDKTYTAQIPPGISKAEIVKMLKKTIRVGLEIVSIDSLKESVNEAKVNYDFSEQELIRVLRQLKRGASTEVKMIKAFEKALGRKITKAELWESNIKESVNEGKYVVYVGMKTNPTVHKIVNSKSEADKLVTKMQKAGKYGNIDKADLEGFKKQFPKKINESVNESISPAKAADVIFNKLAASKLIGKQNRNRAVGVIANLISNMKLESVNEADITVGGKEYKLIKKGSKITLINTKLSADKYIFRNDKQFKAWADDQVEPIGGTQSSHFGINEAKEMVFIDYLKVLDKKIQDGMSAVKGENGSDAAIKPTRGDILQNLTLFRNYISKLSKKYKGDKTKLKFLSEASDVFKIFDEKQKLYSQAMDIEMDMKTIAMDVKQTRTDMEQEAEPGGGKVADRYGKELDKLEKAYDKKKKELKKIFTKLDKLEMM